MIESRTAPDAVEEIDRVLAIEPDNLKALVLRVDANRAAHNVEESLMDIERVLEQDPSNLPVLVTRVTALIELNRIDEAGVALDEAQTSFDEAEEKVAHPMFARLCVARALFTFEAGDTETADRHFADCVERFPTERVAVSEAIAFYDRIGRTGRATEILERAVEESDSGLFRTLLARRLGALGESEEEERLLREEAERRDAVQSWFVLADYYVQNDRFDEAISAFEHAMSAGPVSPRLRFAYADTLVQAERFEKAREVSSRLNKSELRSLIRGRILLGEGNARGALAAFEAGIRLWPNNTVGRFLAGQAAERVGDFPRATSHYRESFRTNPGASEAGRALAELYASQGLHEDALQIASRYIRGHAADPKAYLLTIRLAHAGGRPKIASEGLQRLRQMPGQAAVATAEEASLLAAADGAEPAAQVVEEAGLDLTDASNAIALRVLIDQLGALGQHEKSADLVKRALVAHPDEAVFHELQGRTFHAAEQTDAARAGYQRALELDAQSWRALAGLAALTAEAGRMADALSLYDRSIAAGPDDPAPAFAAIALVRDADPAEAARRLEQLLDAHPRTTSAAYELAEILVDRGELDRAEIYASRAAWFRLPEAEAVLDRIEKRRTSAHVAADSAPPSEPND
jgi:tetratricopeptide (TPR) repeat protein